ncbi:hypothetical protein NZNM25_15050 [Nitrosopumilus zosterae]|uniref:Uncharacterized protein n=1 Tax=Nitrosopumilus zosterae TaxID=718286 RepID=A0A2S2KSV9_9ARCH|nr:hypothetical protein [Nitrosopumilus zosterae]BDQ30673.1 hypothetical protein NZOSNM25_000779 [Nitrosopumilus zosterae]GBH34714.1 hypothetical protein NZNM25_15050 [Nitrosopumilus zosterae]
MDLKIIFFVGVLIITVSTIGLGSNLNSSITFNSIGSDDNISSRASEVDITNVVHSTSGNNIDSSTITIRNTDSVSHSYRICVITKAGSSISDTVGTAPDCATTLISSNNIDSVVVPFTNPLNKTTVDFADISIQEIT